MKPLAPLLAALAITLPGAAQITGPKINGTLRSRFEATLDNGDALYRFQVRNARFSLTGGIARGITYFFNTDLCDRGKMKILDAWGKVALSGNFAVQAGQFRMPFGTEPYRAPHTYIFANRSFIGKQVCNYRAVGMAGIWHAGILQIEAGAFNPTTISDHETWNDRMACAASATATLAHVTLKGGGSSVVDAGLRANMAGASARWHSGRWQAEAEYMHKHFCSMPLPGVHAWCAWADYAMPVEAGVFNRLSLQARADGMTRHAVDPGRTRLTAGTTLTYAGEGVHADVRMNAEKSFFGHCDAPLGQGDKLLLELVVRF